MIYGYFCLQLKKNAYLCRQYRNLSKKGYDMKRLLTILLLVCTVMTAVIRFLQDACLHIVNIYLTLSHNPKSLA